MPNGGLRKILVPNFHLLFQHLKIVTGARVLGLPRERHLMSLLDFLRGKKNRLRHRKPSLKFHQNVASPLFTMLGSLAHSGQNFAFDPFFLGGGTTHFGGQYPEPAKALRIPQKGFLCENSLPGFLATLWKKKPVSVGCVNCFRDKGSIGVGIRGRKILRFFRAAKKN